MERTLGYHIKANSIIIQSIPIIDNSAHKLSAQCATADLYHYVSLYAFSSCLGINLEFINKR